MKALDELTEILSTQVKAANEGTEDHSAPIAVGSWVWIKAVKPKWHDPQWLGPWKVLKASSHAL